MAANNRDHFVDAPPKDTVSSLCWAPKSDFLVSTSWDGEARCWQVAKQGNRLQSMAKALKANPAPLLCSDFYTDSQTVFYGGADNKVQAWTLGRDALKQVAAHQAPVSCLQWLEQPGCLVTGSWDRTIKYWDPRKPSPLMGTVHMPGRVYSLNAKHSLLVVGCSERKTPIFDLKKPTEIWKTLDSPLKQQTRTVACLKDANGFAIGSIEGRCAIHYISANDQKNNFAFKCHRNPNQNDVYPINEISFHPGFGTFATCGSDGSWAFWDHNSRQRLKACEVLPHPITAGRFNHNGHLYAYASAYDWHKGIQGYPKTNFSVQIGIHDTPVNEIKPRRRRSGRR
mmetsp:Transcript_9069/g.13720  ORF Transcript_9069/g.13720 Transcript_9069/m.13720 type:complete len:340 (+) Transcript_9069:53-1072(+)|eukprot:CAMPEP_0201551936 /NCGR_PEP_ID=MMETSP0173_2-20130828/12148_1 /ASSEMBLY_ACC=CAM_ASM_000268 /TAXON_ID=218659 /ORGANISM="Vexillifera sp., Strain DIVA3 564/2" /LENGTH=339 /DNA_ID=CAMNT_0047962307 /DNA_START=53 /DNA_END=1072 /DNA_ORIENTATION=+